MQYQRDTIPYMPERPQPHSKDPTIASQELPLKTQRCISCWSIYPESHFSISSYSKSGVREVCKECRAQAFRLLRKAKYNAKSQVDDSIVRRVADHNLKIVLDGMAQHTLNIYGFSTVSKEDYRVFFGRSQLNSMRSVALFDVNGNCYREFHYSGKDQNVPETIMNLLRVLNIRLEYTEADIITAKATIYYI